MRDLYRFSITEKLVAPLAAARDPRFKQIMTSFIRHLHDFARGIEPVAG